MSEVAWIAGDNGCLVPDGGGDNDGVDDAGGTGGGTGDAGGAPGVLVVGDNVAALEGRLDGQGRESAGTSVSNFGCFLVDYCCPGGARAR